jgi:hypothetical protein
MKKRRSIYLLLPLLLFLLFFSSGNAYSISTISLSHIELTTGNTGENRLDSNLDASDEDQMDQSYMSILCGQYIGQLSYICILPQFDELVFSVWQPPKVF